MSLPQCLGNCLAHALLGHVGEHVSTFAEVAGAASVEGTGFLLQLAPSFQHSSLHSARFTA